MAVRIPLASIDPNPFQPWAHLAEVAGDEAKKELAERADEANERQVDNRTQPAPDGSVSDERADAGDIAGGVSAETTEPEPAEVAA